MSDHIPTCEELVKARWPAATAICPVRPGQELGALHFERVEGLAELGAVAFDAYTSTLWVRPLAPEAIPASQPISRKARSTSATR